MKTRVQTQKLNSKVKHRDGTGEQSVSRRTRAEEQDDNGVPDTSLLCLSQFPMKLGGTGAS